MPFPGIELLRRRASEGPLQRVAFTQPGAPGVGVAAEALRRNGIAVPLLVGTGEDLSRWKADGALPRGVPTVRIAPEVVDRYCDIALSRWGSRGVGEIEARERLSHPDDFALVMIWAGAADGIVAGPASATETLIAELTSTAGFAANCSTVSTCYVVASADGTTRTVVNPSANARSAVLLAETVLESVRTAELLIDTDHRVALVPTTPGAPLRERPRYRSAEERLRDRVWQAANTVRARDETIQFVHDPVDPLRGGETAATISVYCEFQAGDLAHRLRHEGGYAQVLGPIVQGAAVPLNVLPGGSSVDEIVDWGAVTALQAAGAGVAHRTTSQSSNWF